MPPASLPLNPPPPSGAGPCSSRSASRCSATTTSTTRSARVADSLQRLLGFTDTQIGTLNAIYSFPNIVMVLVGGVIVDRFGTRLSTLVFAMHLPRRRGDDRDVAALPGDGRRPADLRPRRRVDDRRRHGGHRPVVRRPSARVRVRRQPEHRARRIVQRRHVDDAGSSRSTTRAGSRRCCWPRRSSAVAVVACVVYYLLERSAARRFDRRRARRRRIGSSGAICGASIAPTGTSSACA